MENNRWNFNTIAALVGLILFLGGVIALYLVGAEASDKTTYLYLTMGIAAVIIAVAAVYAVLVAQGKIVRSEPDYRALFIMGIIFLPFSLGADNYVFLILSITLVAVGLVNRKKWQGGRRWSELSPAVKKFKITLVAVLGLIVLAGFVAWYLGTQKYWSGENQANKPAPGASPNKTILNFDECVSANNPVMESYPRQCRTKEGQSFSENIGNELNKTDIIRLASPRPNQMVKSPLIIEGEARGIWFFEGSFPVVIVDWDGRIIGEAIAQAEGEWMTEGFVPFKATIKFEQPTYSNQGALILRKDNPSGLPEHDDALEIPVRILPPLAEESNGRGVIYGQAAIGPICPVAQKGAPCFVPPEVYTSRQIIVYEQDGATEVARMAINTDATYSFSLTPGSYVLDITGEADDRGEGVPYAFTMVAGESHEFNFSIDTGIR